MPLDLDMGGVMGGVAATHIDHILNKVLIQLLFLANVEAHAHVLLLVIYTQVCTPFVVCFVRNFF